MVEREEWRPIEGFPFYEVSNLGRVRSLDRVNHVRNRWGDIAERSHKGRVLKARRCGNGYMCVVFSNGGKAFLIHRLVASAFVPGDNTLTVNHKDGDRENNRSENLEWLSYGDNIRHSYRELTRKRHCWSTPVLVDDAPFESVSAAARHLGLKPSSVLSALRRGHKAAGKVITDGR